MLEIPKDIFADAPSKCKECNHNTTKWLKEHDKQIANDTIDKFVKHCENGIPYDICDGNEAMEFIREISEQMKGEQNE